MIIEDEEHLLNILKFHLLDGDIDGWCSNPILMRDEYGTKDGHAMSFFGTDEDVMYEYSVHFHMDSGPREDCDGLWTMISFTKTDSEIEDHHSDGFNTMVLSEKLTELFSAIEDKIGEPLRL